MHIGFIALPERSKDGLFLRTIFDRRLRFRSFEKLRLCA